MKPKQIIFLVLAILLSVIITWSAVTKGYINNNKEAIFSFPNIITELVFFAGALFLITEARLHIKNTKNKDIKHNLNRYMRILIGVAVITSHLVVIIYGGY